MKYYEVESSNIKAVAYQDATKTLGIKFHNGGEYHYANVGEEVFDELIAAASVGRTFHSLIKSKPEAYPFTKVN